MIVAPGGGFRTLMMSHEGVDVAKRLNQMGMDAFVLKYRTTYVDPNAPPGAAGRRPAAAGPQAGQNVREMAGADGQQAVRLLRQRAAEYGVLPNRIGFIGYGLRCEREFESAAERWPAAVHRGGGRRDDSWIPRVD